MNFVSIPLAVLDAPQYMAMTPAEQKFLIDLYVLFHDCETFTVDMNEPAKYRQPVGATLNRKIRTLLTSGLIEVVSRRKSTLQRVFVFKYPARETFLEAA